MFSIIIPLYNKAPYIEKAIRSVTAQTFQEFELIVIDDGSTDIEAPQPPKGGVGLTYSDIEQLIDGKGRLIKQKNSGVSVTRNKGVKLAKYDYIAFLDADDWWGPTYLEEMKGLIEDFPEAGIYGSSYYKVKDGKNIPANIGVEPGFTKGLINYCQVYAKTMYMPLTSITSVIKKSVFESENGFKSTLKLGEDFDLWVRVAMKYPVAFLNKPLAYYNQDVEFVNRAIGSKLYEPHEHMLFTDYGDMKNNSDFLHLFEVLAVYGLLPYYISGKNKVGVKTIISKIHWKKHSFKYKLFYTLLPKVIVKFYFEFSHYMYDFKNRH
ncbi:MAG: glycosyltransferase family A protein [Paludibacter sp.]|nr:glycosyltransferase family A protein [Paludibacter sp.]